MCNFTSCRNNGVISSAGSSLQASRTVYSGFLLLEVSLMEGSGFLKTVSFGGFDKKDVLALIDNLNSKINTLQAELDEKAALVAQGGTADNEKYEKLLAVDKQKITELQTNNDSLKMQLKTIEDEAASKDKEIEDLKKKNAELENQLIDAKNKAAAASTADSSAMDLTNVFMEAQKTANSIVTQAKENARKMDEDAKKLANQVVDDANSKASTIVKSADEKANKLLTDAGDKSDKLISSAEAKSAEIISEAEDKSSEMKAAAAKMKAMVLEEVAEMDNRIASIKTAIESFAKDSVSAIDSTQTAISEAKDAFNNGKIPPALESAVPKAAPAPAAKPAPAPAAKPAASAPQPAAAKPAAPSSVPMPAQHTPMKPIPPVAKQNNNAPKPTPKITFDLSEIEQLAKGIEAEAAKGGKANDEINPKNIKVSPMDK